MKYFIVIVPNFAALTINVCEFMSFSLPYHKNNVNYSGINKGKSGRPQKDYS